MSSATIRLFFVTLAGGNRAMALANHKKSPAACVAGFLWSKEGRKTKA